MSILQLKASNPELSTWVSASAGTGKTKILTDRVLRLLLQNTPFNKILCLTFTNAAANEMHERIISQLEKWSKLSREELKIELENTLGRKPKIEEINKAFLLFELYLKTQDQINIHTIHSFCQKILKKFPLEAGISPNFKIIDEIKVAQIIKKLKTQIFNLPGIEPITRFLAENFHELTIDEIFNEIINSKAKILEKKFNISPSKETYSCLINDGEKIIEKLSNFKSANYLDIISDNKIKNLITDILGADLTNENIKTFFLTLDGDKRKKIVKKEIANPDSDLYKELESIQNHIYQRDQDTKKEYLLLYSKLLALIAEKIILEFETYKRKNSLLDYDDLIIYAKNLLTNSYSKEWVLYKLDGFIDHLLVDEAQDTSKNQWRIIESLVEEFYSGESNSSINRTIFIVGDEKQSIFSFQGADIEAFSYMNHFLHKKLREGKKTFENINLDVSYRSSKEILNIVTDVFSKIIRNNPEEFNVNLPEMTAYRNIHSGKVEFWPLCVGENIDDNISTEFCLPQTNTNSSKFILAEKIANYIKKEINSGKILPSTGKKISAEDFMILFRTRDSFTDEVIKALRKAEIDNTGIDRIALSQDLGVIDLLSIAKFIVNPNNNLNLASLLKAPIIGLDEKELYQIVIEARKNEISIWEYLYSENQYYLIVEWLKEFLYLYQNFPLTDFFLYTTDILNERNIINKNDVAIDEFLKLSKNYFMEYGCSMQNFIYWFEENQIIIKMDTDTRNKLRIMTVHGAKGLQSPIIILCDTTKIPTNTERFIWDENDEMLSAKSASYIPEFYKVLKATDKQKAYQEYLRLLYVGMTRAEDHLIICGYQDSNKVSENCWYELIKKSMHEFGTLDTDGNFICFDLDKQNTPDIISIENRNMVQTSQAQILELSQLLSSKKKDFYFHKNHVEQHDNNILINNNYSPLNLFSLEYGLVFHKILEDGIGAKNLANIDTHPLINTLDDYARKRIKASLVKLINNIEFTKLLKYEIKTELSFGYKAGAEIKIGRIDLLVIQEKEINIIDYKSDIKPPAENELIPQNYITQLQFYQRAFTEIYPDRKINCKILWLENGTIQNIEFYRI